MGTIKRNKTKIAMIICILLVLSTVIIIPLTAFNKTPPAEQPETEKSLKPVETLAVTGKNPPARIGTKGTFSSSYVGYHTFEELDNAVDLIADITILNWLCEDSLNGIAQTYFEAEINDTVKGTKLGKITLIQDGNSELTNDTTPLFKPGDRLLLLLYTINITSTDYIPVEGIDYSNTYFTHSGYIVDLIENEDEIYAVDRFVLLSCNFAEIGLKETADINGLYSTLKKNKKNDDSVLYNILNKTGRFDKNFENVYKYTDIKNIFASYNGG